VRNHPSPNLPRINTCKTVTKQTVLTLFRMNTYEKHRGEGVLLLTSDSLERDPRAQSSWCA
jgi:hypothetical protein